MSRPEDIPQDVWDKAYGEALLYVQWLVPAPVEYVQAEHVLATSIARAIMAAKAEEREACARILDERAQEFNRQRDPGMANSCRSHAAAIRKRGEA